MIILHNSHDKESRAFVQAHGQNATIYDWYEGGREAFWSTMNTHEVSAFPSVLVDVPTHIVAAKTSPNEGVSPKHAIPRHQLVIRKPQSMGDVQLALNEINVDLQASAGQGLSVPNLTLQNMSDRKA